MEGFIGLFELLTTNTNKYVHFLGAYTVSDGLQCS